MICNKMLRVRSSLVLASRTTKAAEDITKAFTSVKVM